MPKTKYDERLTSPDGLSYWQRNWLLYKKRSIAKQIPRNVRGELFEIVWEGDALKGLGILNGDTVVVIRTPHIDEGDLVCTEDRFRDNEGYVNLGVLSFNTGDDYIAFTFPGRKRKPETHPCLIRFLGRAVEVRRNGKRVAIQFRPVESRSFKVGSQEMATEMQQQRAA